MDTFGYCLVLSSIIIALVVFRRDKARAAIELDMAKQNAERLSRYCRDSDRHTELIDQQLQQRQTQLNKTDELLIKFDALADNFAQLLKRLTPDQ